MAKQKKLKREISAGGVVFKKESGRVFWLLVRPRRDKKDKVVHWRFPKGLIEKKESAPLTAVREVEEEAGVKAEALKKIGQTTYFYNFKGQKVFKIIIFFLMKFLAVTGKPDKKEVRELVWLPFKEAREKLTFKNEREILTKAKEIFEDKEKQPGLF